MIKKPQDIVRFLDPNGNVSRVWNRFFNSVEEIIPTTLKEDEYTNNNSLMLGRLDRLEKQIEMLAGSSIVINNVADNDSNYEPNSFFLDRIERLEKLVELIPEKTPNLPFYLGEMFEFRQDGTLVFKNNGHLLHGSMYGDDISQTIAIAATGTYYELGASLSDGGSNGFTFQNSKELKCLIAGDYFVTWSMSMECAAAGQYAEGSVMINSTAQMNTVGAFELITANKMMNAGGTGRITLAVDDVVKLCAENETATNDLIVTHANLALFQIGG